MSLESTAQFLEITDGPDSSLVVVDDSPSHGEFHLEPLIHEEPEHLEVSDQPDEFEIVFDEIPGAPGFSPEEELKVSEEDTNDVKEEEQEEVIEEDPKTKKWNWSSKLKESGPDGFVLWIKEMNETIPKHSGKDTAGLERAKSYLEKLDDEISKAMRQDLDGELDSNKIEKIRFDIENSISRLQAAIESFKKSKKKKKAGFEVNETLIKQAQKITGVHGVMVTVPLLISRVARVCVNGCVSAGHDIEEIYREQVKKYKLNDREQAEVMQLLSDMGFPLRQDRGFLPDEDKSEGGFDWSQNFKG